MKKIFPRLVWYAERINNKCLEIISVAVLSETDSENKMKKRREEAALKNTEIVEGKEFEKIARNISGLAIMKALYGK